jgi:hypothetical protein
VSFSAHSHQVWTSATLFYSRYHAIDFALTSKLLFGERRGPSNFARHTVSAHSRAPYAGSILGGLSEGVPGRGPSTCTSAGNLAGRRVDPPPLPRLSRGLNLRGGHGERGSGGTVTCNRDCGGASAKRLKLTEAATSREFITNQRLRP